MKRNLPTFLSLVVLIIVASRTLITATEPWRQLLAGLGLATFLFLLAALAFRSRKNQ